MRFMVWGKPGKAPPMFIAVHRDGDGRRFRAAALASTARTHKTQAAMRRFAVGAPLTPHAR